MTIPFLSVTPKSIKCKVSPRFPALLNNGTGTTVVKSNGNYAVNLDYSHFPQVVTLPGGYTIAAYDNVGNYSLVPLSLISGGAVLEAPSDGTVYGRQNAGWIHVLPLTGGTLTGPLLLVTPTAGDNSTKAATTAFVVSSFAPLASPALTGTPTVPTATVGTNTTQVASTAFVQASALLKANNLSDVVSATTSRQNLGVDYAVKADQQTGTATNKTVTPAHQQDHDSAAKAWGVIGPTGTLQAGYNVASVVRNSAGLFTVTFTTAFASANYAITATGSTPNGYIAAVTSQSAGTCQLNTFNTAGASNDPGISLYFACFGRQ